MKGFWKVLLIGGLGIAIAFLIVFTNIHPAILLIPYNLLALLLNLSFCEDNFLAKWWEQIKALKTKRDRLKKEERVEAERQAAKAAMEQLEREEQERFESMDLRKAQDADLVWALRQIPHERVSELVQQLDEMSEMRTRLEDVAQSNPLESLDTYIESFRESYSEMCKNFRPAINAYKLFGDSVSLAYVGELNDCHAKNARKLAMGEKNLKRILDALNEKEQNHIDAMEILSRILDQMAVPNDKNGGE